MSTVLCIIKSETKLQASNEEATIVLDLPLDHPAAKLFPAGKSIVFAKCRVADGKVTVINPCKPWRK
jgi:hypothetical protein